SGNFRQPALDLAAQAGERHAGVLADGHACRAGVVRYAFECHPVLPYPDDARDDAQVQIARFQNVALLDVGLDIGDVVLRIAHDARPARQAGALEGIAQLDAARWIESLVDLLLGEVAAEGPAANEVTEMTLLVCPRPYVHDL